MELTCIRSIWVEDILDLLLRVTLLRTKAEVRLKKRAIKSIRHSNSKVSESACVDSVDIARQCIRVRVEASPPTICTPTQRDAASVSGVIF